MERTNRGDLRNIVYKYNGAEAQSETWFRCSNNFHSIIGHNMHNISRFSFDKCLIGSNKYIFIRCVFTWFDFIRMYSIQLTPFLTGGNHQMVKNFCTRIRSEKAGRDMRAEYLPVFNTFNTITLHVETRRTSEVKRGRREKGNGFEASRILVRGGRKSEVEAWKMSVGGHWSQGCGTRR